MIAATLLLLAAAQSPYQNRVETRPSVADAQHPGLGLPLAGVHPGWRVRTVETQGVPPKIGALAVLPDGRVAFGTFDPLQRTDEALPDIESKPADHLYAWDPKTGSVSEIAGGILEPTGLCVIGKDLYVAQRRAILKLSDADGDGMFEQRATVAEGWEGWNYHQFAFCLVQRRGLLYTALSTSMGPPKWEGMQTNAGPNGPMRGSILEIDPESGDVRVLAGGARTPNGLALGPEETLLYVDNQGAWLPTSTMHEVLPGRFFGHYNWTHFIPLLAERFPDGGHPSSFCDRPVAPPVLFLPHNEVVNSPTEPLLIPDGPFAGQMLIGELTGGGIRRAYLERIDGVLQGALFRFTQGLSSGVNRLAWGPKGSLYVGGMGAREGNWNWQGTQGAFEILEPTSEPVFEFETVQALPDGLRLTFTEPVDPRWLADSGNYAVRSWTYRPTQQYGGKKIDDHPHAVRAARPSGDGRSVDLEIEGLATGRCVHVRCEPTALTGRKIWSGEAWYTLQRIPGAQDAPDTGLGAPCPADGVQLLGAVASPHFAYAREGAENPRLRQDDCAYGQGYVTVGQGSGNLVSKFEYGDAHIHAEWYCPPGGEGDTRSNSGLYLHGRYEVQIFATPAGEAPAPRAAGSIYGQAAPQVNASTGPGTWQSYDAIFRAPVIVDGEKIADARLTLYWNGRLVHEDQAIPEPTGSSKGETETSTGVLLFQDYRTAAEGPVRLRNIWIRPLPAGGAPAAPHLPLDGVSASPWSDPFSAPERWAVRGGEADFVLAGGVLTGTSKTGTPNSFFTSLDPYTDFELTFDCLQDPGLNSGVQFRSQVQGGIDNRSGALEGYQFELDPSPRAWTAGIYEERGRAWLHNLQSAPYARRAWRTGQWNHFRLLARGPRMQTWINGVPAADLFDAKRPSGHIAFQVHSVAKGSPPMQIQWRNVRIRRLSPQ
ncbi:MAG: family 16 glycoside hydrolase [Planctomycetota bacterium]